MKILTKIGTGAIVVALLATSLIATMPKSVSAQTVVSTVTRSFSTATPVAGSSLTVTLAVTIVSPDTVNLIDETVPVGWVVTSATGGGDFTSQVGHVKWAVISGAVSTSYQYTITVPSSATGVATFSGTYSTDVTVASPAAILGSTTVTVQAAPTLTTITVTPATPSIAAGATQQFTAVANDQNGVPLATQPTFSWTSATPATATIDATTGIATGVSAGGPVTITATSGAVSGTASLTVTAVPPVLTSVSIAPATTTLMVGSTTQLTASPIDQFGSAFAGATLSWTSSNTAAATVDAATGLVTALAAGTTTVTVSATIAATTVTNTALVIVVPVPVLTTIAVVPATASVAVGSIQQFTATALDQFGVALATQPTITWSSSSSTIATIDTAGLATSIATGSSTISATSGAVSGTAVLTVTPVPILTSIALSATSTSMIVGATHQFTATALDQFGVALATQPTFTWASASTSIATVDSATGLATAVAVGTTTLTVSSGAINNTVAITVTPVPVLTSIAITPVNPSVAIGVKEQFSAIALDQFGVAMAIQPTITWSSSSTTVAIINASGLASALATGTSTITATSGAVTGTTTLSVINLRLTSITVTPSAGIVQVGGTLQLHATGLDQNGVALTTQPMFTWTSSNPTAASISISGLATGLVVGTSTITASNGAISGTAMLTVSTSTRMEINDDLMEMERDGSLVSERNDEDFASSTDLMTTHEVHITLHGSGGNSEIDLPMGVKISRDDNSKIDGTTLVATSTDTGSLSGLDSSMIARAAFKWGIMNHGLIFSTPITLKIFVGSSFEGQTLNIVRSISGTGSWTSDGIVAPATCVVTNGQCTFQATKASYYMATSPALAAPVSSGGGGGGGGGGGPAGFALGSNGLPIFPSVNVAVASPAASNTTTGEVLGATVYNFAKNLTIGSRGADVTALQQFLIGSGYSIPAGVTGYFGAQTKAAVMAFQKAHGIAQVGSVGPLTRAELNKGEIATTPENSSNSGLTDAQVNSILSVLQSFGVDQATMSRVRAAL